MQTPTDIRIDERFVIHVLDNRQPVVQCSQALTPLPDTLRTTLAQYLTAIVRPQFRRKHFARFRPASAVQREYQQLVSMVQTTGRVGDEAFLHTSQRLAALLFQAMRQPNQNGAASRPGEITPGDLLVGMFTQPSAAHALPNLFVIKVDLESGLQRQTRSLPSGGVEIVLAACDGLLPKLDAQHVHKSALIYHNADASHYDVLMTDPQGAKQGVAKFFAEDFLQTDAFHTADEQAEMLFMRTHAWVQEHADSLTPQEQTEVLQSVRTLITERAERAQPFTANDLVATLPLTAPRPAQSVLELRHSLQETLTASEENGRSIPLDRELRIQTVPQRVAKTSVTYQLDDGVRLSGDQDAIARLFTRPPHREGEATEFTIRTKLFRQIV